MLMNNLTPRLEFYEVITRGVLQDYLHDNGIIHQISCVDVLAQNGVAEQRNRHFSNVAGSLLFTMQVPKTYWGDAIFLWRISVNALRGS